MKLESSVVVITGAAGGLGSSMARRLAAKGSRLALNDMEKAKLDAVAGEMGLEAARCVADQVQGWGAGLANGAGAVPPGDRRHPGRRVPVRTCGCGTDGAGRK